MTTPGHEPACDDEEGVLDGCVCGNPGPPDTYNPDDREPMAGDPWWAQENDQ